MMVIVLIPVIIILLAAVVLLVYIHLGTNAMIRRRTSDVEDSPAAYGLHFDEVAFRSRDGLELCGRFIPALQPAAPGTVIFCHGQAGSMDRDTAWALPFHQAGFDVMMFDFRGHGKSAGDIVTLGYFERFDLLGALDFLEQRGIERVAVIGFSMGGAIAMSVAKEHPAIAAVVSDSGYASLKEVLTGASRERGMPYLLAVVSATLLLKCANRRLGVDLAAHEPAREVDAGFRCPLLLIQGDNDPYVPVNDIKALAEHAGGPTELWLVPVAGHRAAREQYPELYAQRVLNFFNQWLITTEE